METDLAALAARVQRLEDLDAVRATVHDYCNCLDRGDFADLADVFTEDAELELMGLARSLDGTYRSRRSIIDDFYARTADPSSHRFMTGHITTNLQIDLDGDTATTLGYFFEIVDGLLLIGIYQHRLRRDPDRWRLAFLRIAIRYRSRLEASGPGGLTMAEVVARAV
jgi:ketosteroid isomerase-like protein